MMRRLGGRGPVSDTGYFFDCIVPVLKFGLGHAFRKCPMPRRSLQWRGRSLSVAYLGPISRRSHQNVFAALIFSVVPCADPLCSEPPVSEVRVSGQTRLVRRCAAQTPRPTSSQGFDSVNRFIAIGAPEAFLSHAARFGRFLETTIFVVVCSRIFSPRKLPPQPKFQSRFAN